MIKFPFQPEQRIRNGDDFRSVFSNKASVADEVLIIYGRMTDLPHARLGLSVSRKVGNAVVRNKWKRRIREAFRVTFANIDPPMDLVVIPRQGIEPQFQPILASFSRLTKRLGRKLTRAEK